MRIGVDTGGTFTDCVVCDAGLVRILKVFSTPENAARAIVEGVEQLARGITQSGTEVAGGGPELDIIHGTTVGTNSLLERKGARVALVTTAGFEDLLEIGRQARPHLYDLNVQRDPPLVPRAWRFGVSERVGADAKILKRPSPSELRRLARRIQRLRADSIAVCFLFSFANCANESEVARRLRSLGIPVSVSHEILPAFREYERLSTTVTNAYLAPRMGSYLSNLERGIPRGRVYVMQSSGGITTATRAAREPVRTILSGPAGGVVATAWLARHLGIARAISFDMGGTSTDVCLLDGRPRTTSETTLGGLPIAVPVLDVHSVGAGGGSLARIDTGGALRVGPESAGAEPGPVCYGRGGERLTVTDANLILGRLDADFFLGGKFHLQIGTTEAAFEKFLQQEARKSNARFKTLQELAGGIVTVSNATMEKALRVVSVERGHDPREFALICFGGAGGLHAAELARSLRIPKVIVPRDPGAFSALGILLSDVVRDVVQSVLLLAQEKNAHPSHNERKFLNDLTRRFNGLEQAGRADLRREGFAVECVRVEPRLDLRYRGQSYELSIPFSSRFREAFHHEHEKAYGYAHRGRPIEIVNLRVRLTVPTPKPPARAARAPGMLTCPIAPAKHKQVWFDGRRLRTPLFTRDSLPAGTRLSGPAVIVEYSSTSVVPPGFVCTVDKYLNLNLEKR